MKELIYRHERPLFIIAAVLATLIWLAALVGTVGFILIFLLLMFLSYLFVHAGFIAWIKGNGIEVSNEQFPELYTRYTECCAKLNIDTPPRLYILNSHGMLNALATRFLRKDFVVLFSSIVDALERKPSLVKFYIGHELGHIQRGHLTWGPFLAPVLWLPLLGSAYSRAREYTCDRYGLTCSDSPVDACYALTVLASGDRKWAEVKLTALLKQVDETSGFWMSYHELTNDYPWLTKRLAHIVALGRSQSPSIPKRNPIAYLFALLTPRSAVPGGGAIFFFVALIAIVAAVAIPAYKQYQERAMLAQMEAQMSQNTSEENGYPSYEPQSADEEDGHVENTDGFDQTLLALQYIVSTYVEAYKSHPTERVTLDMLELTEADLQQAGIQSAEFSDTAAVFTLIASDPQSGGAHRLRIVPAYEDDGVAMYPRCDDTTLPADKLTEICRQPF